MHKSALRDIIDLFSTTIIKIFSMEFFKDFRKTKKSKKQNDAELIDSYNKQIENYQQQVTKYINKFLQNEEKWKVINELIKTINSTLEIDDILKLICAKIITLINTDICSIYTYETELQKLQLKYSEIQNESDKLSYMNKFIQDKNIFLNKFINPDLNIYSKSIKTYLNENLNKNYRIVPINNNSSFFGIIFLYKESEKIQPEEINILQIIAENISMALQNADLYQKLKQSNTHKVEFIASLSHEFKTPLNTIIGFSEILKYDDTLNKIQINKYMQNILNCSKHMLRLIEDIQDAAIAETGNISIHKEKFNTKYLINETIAQLESLIHKKNLSLSIQLVDTIITADIKRFRQIIYNLFSNAVKFSNINGKIKVITYLHDDKFLFEINNTGQLIDPKEKNKMFELFYQGASSKQITQEGAGIGLALCKKIIDLHNGEIDFNSEEGNGTTFWFSLPIKESKKHKMEEIK